MSARKVHRLELQQFSDSLVNHTAIESSSDISTHLPRIVRLTHSKLICWQSLRVAHTVSKFKIAFLVWSFHSFFEEENFRVRA